MENAPKVEGPSSGTSVLSAGLGRWYQMQPHRGVWAINWQSASGAWKAATANERERCANILNLSRSDALLMAGEMTAQEWRTVAAVLKALQSRMRPNVEFSGDAPLHGAASDGTQG